MKIASTSRMRAGFARMLVITKLLSLMSAAEVWAQNDSGEEVGTLVARWTFEDETLAGVKLEREEGPRPPWYPGFATKNQAWRVADQGVIIREHDLPGVNLRFGQGEAFTLEAWVRLEELADGQYAYVIGKGRSRRAGYPEQNQNYSLRLWGQKGMAHLSLLFASLADGGHRQWHRWNSISGFLLDGRWHHVAASYRFGDPESVRGWIDGQRVQGRWDLGGPTTHPPVVDDDVLILGSGNGGGSGNTLRGSVDEVAIWRGVLPDSVLASRYQYLPPPPPIVRDEVPAGRVLIQLCETGMPSRNAWPTEPPAATESYFEEVFGLFEVPHKYIDTGVRADRQHPYVLRAAAWVTLPEGEHRWLLRGRGASRLYVDDTLVLTLPFPPTDASGHGQVSAQREYLDLGPTFRLAPPGNREAWTTLYSPGRPQWVVLETIVGSYVGKQRRRPELGETVVAVSYAGSDAWWLLSPGERRVPYTDAGWAAYAEERQAHYARVNAARRAACWQQQAAYWQERRALAQTWLASTAEVTIPALPPGWPAHNAIDHFLAARCLEVQQSEPPTHELPVRFHQHIKPILEAQCWGCHSGSRPKGGLRLDLRESALRGGDSGEPALVPGNLSASVLWQRVTADDPALRMPPQRDPLSPEQLELLTAWINAGAPWPQVSAVRLQPTALCADEVFLRRVFLDTLGVIPTWSEIADFFTQPADTRREWLITRCLHDPRWADHWVSYWQDVLAENPNILNPTLNNTGPFRWWLYEALSDHKPLDVLVTELVRLRGSERFGGPAGFAIASQNDAPLAEKGMILAAAFLGVNMKCARCHDAPAHVSRQQDLFGLAAMLQREAVKVPTTSSVPVDALHRGGRQPLITVTLPPGSVVPPTWPFPQFIEPALAERYAQDPHDLRDRLAALITLPQNERFPQVLANRIWQRLFGRGLIEPVDDWERGHVTHPELLRWLGRELVRSGYDLRHLVGLILRSHAYQREADLTLAAPDPLVMAPVSRRMTAEQIVDSAFVATGKPFRLEEVSLDIDGIRDLDNSITLGQPRRAWMLTSTSNERDRPSLSLPRIQAVVDVLQAYGWRGARQDPVSTRDHTPNVLQPALLAHSTLGRWLTRLSDDHGITQLALETPDLPHLVDQLFWRFLTRPPRPHERTECLAYLTPGFEQRVLPPPPPPPASGRRQRPFYVSWSNHLDPEATVLRQQEEAAARAGDPPTQRLDPAWRQRLEDVVWSLLNHAEFLFYP